LPEDVNAKFSRRFCNTLRCSQFCFADRVQQCCEPVCSFASSGRRREIALRMAIGASRASVVRLFVFESLLVSLIAGAVGAFVAWRLVPLVPGMASNFLPLEEMRPRVSRGRPFLHHRPFVVDWSSDGNLSGAARIAC